MRPGVTNLPRASMTRSARPRFVPMAAILPSRIKRSALRSWPWEGSRIVPFWMSREGIALPTRGKSYYPRRTRMDTKGIPITSVFFAFVFFVSFVPFVDTSPSTLDGEPSMRQVRNRILGVRVIAVRDEQFGDFTRESVQQSVINSGIADAGQTFFGAEF